MTETPPTDALSTLMRGLVTAGAQGLDCDGATLFARSPDGLEFQASAKGAYRLAIRFAVRASQGEQAAFLRAHPKARLAIAEGETELTLTLPLGADLAAGLADWHEMVHAAAVAAVAWRRGQRPLHGM